MHDHIAIMDSTEDLNETLIEEVRKHSYLYNMQSFLYRDQKMRQDAWIEIGKQLNMSSEKAKETWEKLRRCFANASKRRRDKIGPQTRRIHPWKYERQMSFLSLKSQPPKEKPSSDDDVTQKEDAEDTILQEAIVNNDWKPSSMEIVDIVSDNVDLKRIKEENSAQSVVEEQTSVVLEDETTQEEEKIKFQILENGDSCVSTRTKKEEDCTTKPALELLENLDDTDLFFLSMAKMTKKLSKIEQTNIKLTISNTVLQAELRDERARESHS